ncbi:hypothetical protein GCM10007874_42150 [Labrys miyagiensis]|uniref:DUF2155 domain-containing protein n=1 Tax=Labrys miyagiensis TaxID=346912 RepID=A0ABQ6CLJ0_9HYPH|nr:hypothetical protein GCM10007874_42150 [Labrys miyagiensis]
MPFGLPWTRTCFPLSLFASSSLRCFLLTGLALAGVSAATGVDQALAERIANPTAVFTGLDKISGEISTFEVPVGQTVKFGALSVTPRVCYSRSASEDPQTTSFVEIDEMTLSKKVERLFNGWMFAASPGLNGVEHPVYDVWLNDCKGGKSTEPPPPPVVAAAPGPKPGKGKKGKQPVDETAPPPPDAGDNGNGNGDFFDQPVDPNAPQD